MTLMKEISLQLDEKINYDNFKFNAKSDEVEFRMKNVFKMNQNSNSSLENITLNHLNQGLLEALTTLTNPPKYQEGLNSLFLLFNKAVGQPEEFIKKLFTVFSFDYFIKNKEKVMNTILKNYPPEKAEEIYNLDKEYSLGYIGGFYEWILILGDTEAIKNSKWPETVFNMSPGEVYSILGEESYLFTMFTWFNENLSFKFNCVKKGKCGPEIIFRQFNDLSVTKSLGISNLKELNDLIDPILYPFEESPEFISYYNSKNTNQTNDEYINEIYYDDEQLFKLFYQNSTSLLDSNNIIDLLFYYKTGDLYLAYNKFKFRSNRQLQFISDYIFEYLPKLFISPNIDNKNGMNETVTKLSQGFTHFLQIAVDRTFPKLIKNIKAITISKILEKKLEISHRQETFCQDVIMNAINDTNRTIEICQNKELNLTTYKGLKNWILPAECIQKNLTNCRENEKNFLKNLANMTDDELSKVYSVNIANGLANSIKQVMSIIRFTYKCGNCEDEDLARLQFLDSRITFSPPNTISDKKATSLYYWDREEYPLPMELSHYMMTHDCRPEDCSNERNTKAVLSLYNILNNSTHISNREAFSNRLLLRKVHSLFYKGIVNGSTYEELEIQDPVNYMRSLQSFIANSIKSDITTNYDNLLNLIQGHSTQSDDNYYLDLLRSGNYYENFRPNLESTTGFDLNMEDSVNNHISNNVTFKTGFNGNENNVRRITNMNNFNVFNTFNKIYSPLNQTYNYKNVPLFGDFFLNDKYFYLSDGFQFSADRNTIHYFDSMSQRVLEFKYSKGRPFTDNLDCDQYVLNQNISMNLNEDIEMENLNSFSEIGTSFGRFNKPYLISKIGLLDGKNVMNVFPAVNIINKIKEDSNNNYICVDKYSDMVLQFDITLMYSIYTGNYNQILKTIPENTIIPYLIHSRKYLVNNTSYDLSFPGVSEFSLQRLISLIIGLSLVLVFLILAVCLCIRYKSGKSIMIDNERLVNSH